MAAIIRIKRRLDEEPLDTVLVNCKRQKTNTNEDEISTIFKRSTTEGTKDTDILEHVKQSTKSKLEDNYKTHTVDLYKKIKQEGQEIAKTNRYKVINLQRSIDPTTLENQAVEDGHVTIVDIEIQIDDDVEIKNNETSSYVYDLYYTNSDRFPEIDLNELISVYPLSDDLVYDNAQDDTCQNEENADDSDSNDENNWRNDYPDESDHESITEDDILNAMNRIDLNGENELSSDDGEEALVYSIDNEDLDLTDVNKFGKQYARFKAKFKRAESSNLEDYDNSSESSNDNYY